MLKKQASDAAFPCLKMTGGGRSSACYPCRMRKKTCNVDTNGPIKWIPLETHYVDANLSAQRSLIRGRWMRRRDLEQEVGTIITFGRQIVNHI
jgi:hypothetical protein